MKKLLLIVSLVLLLLLMVLGGSASYFLDTDDGLQKLLALAKQQAPGDLSWQRAQGRLTGPLDIQGFRYRQDDGLEIVAGAASLRWQPRALLSRRLEVERLSARDLEIHLPKPAEKPRAVSGPLTLPDIRLPLAISVKALDLANIRIYRYGVDEPIVIERLKLAAAAGDDGLRLLQFQVQSQALEADLSGTLTPEGVYPMALALNWRYHDSVRGEFQGKGSVNGDLARLRIDQQVSGPVNLTLGADVSGVLHDPRWKAELTADSKDLGSFHPALVGAPLTANLHSSGGLEHFDLSGQVDTALKQTGPLRADLRLNGTAEGMHLEPVRLRFKERPGEVTVKGDLQFEKLRANLRLDWRLLDWPVVGTPQYHSEHGALAFKGTPQAFTAHLTAALDGQSLMPLDLVADAHRHQSKLVLDSVSLKPHEGDLSLQASGRFDLDDHEFEARGGWQSFQWPMSGESLVSSPTGTFKAAGRLDDYRFELQAKTSGSKLPSGDWRLTGKGSDQALEHVRLTAAVLGGTLATQGHLAWQPAVTWDVALKGKGLDPGKQWPQAPGRLDVALHSTGMLTDQGPEVTADIERLKGRLRGQPVRGQGRVVWRGGQLDLHKIRLSSGKARLRLDGGLGDDWNLRWALRAEQLDRLLPGYAGSISGRGRLRGSKAQPRADFNIKVAGFSGAGTAIESLSGKGVVDISGRQKSHFDIHGKGLSVAGQSWRMLRLEGDGVPKAHALRLHLSGEAGSFEAVLEGGLTRVATASAQCSAPSGVHSATPARPSVVNASHQASSSSLVTRPCEKSGLKNGHWQGFLKQLSAGKTVAGDWQLQRPARIEAGASAARVSGFCLISQPSRLCLDGDWSADNGAAARLSLSHLDPMRFREFLPAGLSLDTHLDGEAKLHLDADNRIDATATAKLSPGVMHFRQDGEPLRVALKAGTLQATIRGDRADGRVVIDLGETGNIKAVAGVEDFQHRGGLSGELVAALNDLSPLSAFVPSLQEVRGRVDADLKLGGTLTAPRVGGQLVLQDFSAEVPQTAMKLEATQLRIHSDGSGAMKIDGSARSGEGQLSLTGKIDPARRQLTVKLTGDRFEVARSRTLKAVISPDMQVAMDAKGMRVSGILKVPSAYIDLKGAGGEGAVIKASEDVVLVDDGQATSKKAPGSQLDLDLKIELGDDIRVNVADFSGGLKGGLRIEQTRGLAPRGTGMIEIINGDYLVYGQQLNIQRGKILFGGGPVDNPRLEIDVARRVEAYNVLAGAHIRGVAQAPQLKLYSEPPMPDASVLSYMLLGQPPGTKGGSYTLGKYLTPDLYVGYSIGLLNAINTFNLRYKLTDKLGLQAASGLANSADLIYTIER